jgi:hypothetical protein
LLSRSYLTDNPVVVLVVAIKFTITSRLVRGLPLQFDVIAEKRRCSILFHLLVPTGKWQTVIFKLASSPVTRPRGAKLILTRPLQKEQDIGLL